MFTRILIANRGEIAVRIARTCHDLGVEVVVVHSDPDADARHVAEADRAVLLPGTAATDTYLNLGAIVDAARETGAQAIHPGYGFLSERAEAAEAVVDAGLVWIGPPPEATRASGDKLQARRLAESAGVQSVPGTLDPVRHPDEVRAFGERFGWPVAIKAAGGGGGRGLRIADGPDDVDAALESAAREAQAYFGSGDVYLERYLSAPKHIEIQILSPAPGEAMWVGARDCSLQRRHQKLIEETPPPRHADLVPAMGEAAVRVANACGYVNAGTVEFLVDPEANAFYFLEVNARLQVEHTITEQVHGIDLVAAQLRIAAGDELGFGPEDLRESGRLAPRGHAIECRINAEDPAKRFLPKPGPLRRYREPGGPGIRVDSGFVEGDVISPAYDSLIAKLIAGGADREEARHRMIAALREYDIQGIPTTIPAHLVLLENPEFVAGTHTTRTVESGALAVLRGPEATAPRDGASAVLIVGAELVRLWHPAMAGSAASATLPLDRGPGDVVAPMHGTILSVLAADGDRVAAGDAIAVLEAMKMETPILSPAAGTVAEVIPAGAVVEAGQTIAKVR